MSEIEALTKTLVNVISSLKQIISKKGGSEYAHEPQTPLKKTPQMTYNDFIKQVLKNKQPVEVNSKYTSYCIQEDLQLLQSLSAYKVASIKTFQQISKSKMINRSTQSLRSRYHDYLYNIDEKDMKKIVNWIEKEGLRGYLVFENDDLKIQHADPRQKKVQEKKRQRAIKQEQQLKKHQKIKRMADKSSMLSHQSKQLRDVLKLYSKISNIPIQTLADRLQQLSGNLEELNEYIETKDARMLWTKEQDQILRKNDKQIQVIRRYRGSSGIEARRKFLGLA